MHAYFAKHCLHTQHTINVRKYAIRCIFYGDLMPTVTSG